MKITNLSKHIINLGDEDDADTLPVTPSFDLSNGERITNSLQ